MLQSGSSLRPGFTEKKKTGPFGCIGKQLALMEIHAVISLLIARFDVSLAPGEDGSNLLERTKDTFTMRLGDLNIVFLEKGGL